MKVWAGKQSARNGGPEADHYARNLAKTRVSATTPITPSETSWALTFSRRLRCAAAARLPHCLPSFYFESSSSFSLQSVVDFLLEPHSASLKLIGNRGQRFRPPARIFQVSMNLFLDLSWFLVSIFVSLFFPLILGKPCLGLLFISIWYLFLNVQEIPTVFLHILSVSHPCGACSAMNWIKNIGS